MNTPYNLSTAAGGGVVAVGWNDYDEKKAVEQPYVATSTDGGATFGAPVKVDPSDPHVAYPQLAAADNGDLFVGVTLYETDEGDGRAGLYRSRDKGTSFELLADLSKAPRVAFSDVGTTVAVSRDGRTVVMAWLSPTPGQEPWSLIGVVSHDGGTTFSEPVRLSEDAGEARPRAFAGPEGAGVVAVVNVPLPNPPKPTPSRPNPVTSWHQVGVFPVQGDGFGKVQSVTTETDAAADKGPAEVPSGAMAWWQTSGKDTALVVKAHEGAAAAAAATRFTTPSPVELALSGSSLWALTANVPQGDSVVSAPLVLLRSAEGGSPEVVTAVDPVVSKSAEEYDLAPVDGGVVLAWFDKRVIITQKVTG